MLNDHFLSFYIFNNYFSIVFLFTVYCKNYFLVWYKIYIFTEIFKTLKLDFEYKITFWIHVLVLWIHKGYLVIKKLVWNVRIQIIFLSIYKFCTLVYLDNLVFPYRKINPIPYIVVICFKTVCKLIKKNIWFVCYNKIRGNPFLLNETFQLCCLFILYIFVYLSFYLSFYFSNLFSIYLSNFYLSLFISFRLSFYPHIFFIFLFKFYFLLELSF